MDCALAAHKNATEADHHDGVPILFLGLEQPLGVAAGDDRAVDHDVQSATLLDSELHQPVDFAPPRRVRLDEDRCPTVLRDKPVGGHAALTGLKPDVSDHDARLLGGEGQRHREAQPGGAARHHNRLPF